MDIADDKKQIADEAVKRFEERSAKRKQVEAESEQAAAERLRDAYMRRTGRKEYRAE